MIDEIEGTGVKVVSSADDVFVLIREKFTHTIKRKRSAGESSKDGARVVATEG